jgi:hypothetical protein
MPTTPSKPIHESLIAVDSTLPSNDAKMIVDNTKEESPSLKTEEPKEEETTCPLFLNSLPTNFASNSGLAAIASLFNDESDGENNERKEGRTSEVHLKSGGGKATKQRTLNRRHSPYKKKETSVSEAQLFLSMWKM